MTPHQLVQSLTKKARAITPEEAEMLLRDATETDLIDALLVSWGSPKEIETRLMQRSAELRAARRA